MKPRSSLRLVFALTAGLLVASAATTAGQVPRPRPKPTRSQATRPSMTESARPQGAGRGARSVFAVTAAVSESEPNDSIPDADSAALGDTLSGAIDSAGDVDWFTFEVTADTTVVLDVYAYRAGSYLDPVLFLFAPDTGGLFTRIAYSDDFYDLDSHIRIHLASGRYYATLIDYYGSGGPSYTYALSFSFAPLGPGDPTTLYATSLGATFGSAAGPAGELYITDVSDARRVLRVDPDGAVVPVASFAGLGLYPLHAVVDGLGNVLVTAEENNSNYALVERITPNGAVSTFASGFRYANGITVGPDGDVWVLTNNGERPALLRFDPAGARKDSIDITATNAHYYGGSIAFSPDGVLHFANGYDGVFKLVNRAPQTVISAAPYVQSLAFDRDGYLYVSNGSGYVSLYDQYYNVVNLTFASSNLDLEHVMYIAFARDASGAMTSRLFATNSPLGQVFEMNPLGVRAPGYRVGADLLAITPASLPAGTMGADYRLALAVASPPGTPTWSISAGAPPGGLTLDASSGVLSGVLTTSGSFTFTVRVSAGGALGFGGYTLTVTRPELSVDAVADHLLAGPQLDVAVLRFLDFQGNNNGRYDVGDFRAYLRATGRLPASASAERSRP